MNKTGKVELLLNPFCMADRDRGILVNICNKLKVELAIYNTWEITEARLSKMPDYMHSFISDVRKGEKPGSVYSQVFINGNRFHLTPTRLEKIERLIKEMIGVTV